MNKPITVQIVYRNYRKLHPLFKSYVDSPPDNVKYIIPPVRNTPTTRFFFNVYRKLGRLPGVPLIIDFVLKLFFNNDDQTGADLLEYIQVTHEKIPKRPYIIDVEHAGGLFNFLKPIKRKHTKVLAFLSDKNCKQIICMSEAAKRSFKQYFNHDELELFMEKVKVIYPALPDYYNMYKDKIDYSIIPNSNKLKLLFVGNDVYRKGLHEVLAAYDDPVIRENCELHINSNLEDELKERYKIEGIYFYEPKYSHTEMITKFFLPADLFIMPTHGDTFGMVFLDALSTRTPVILTKQFATPEMVEDGREGVFVKSERLMMEEGLPMATSTGVRDIYEKDPEKILVEEIREKIKIFIDDRARLESMSQNCNVLFQGDNKFSIKRRNSELSKVFNQALQE